MSQLSARRRSTMPTNARPISLYGGMGFHFLLRFFTSVLALVGCVVVISSAWEVTQTKFVRKVLSQHGLKKNTTIRNASTVILGCDDDLGPADRLVKSLMGIKCFARNSSMGASVVVPIDVDFPVSLQPQSRSEDVRPRERDANQFSPTSKNVTDVQLKPDRECPRALLHMVYHKTGTVLSRNFFQLLRKRNERKGAVYLNQRGLNGSPGEKWARIRRQLSAGSAGGRLHELVGASYRLSDADYLYGHAEFSTVGLYRDPYAMIISGYLYHAKTDEPWCHKKEFNPCKMAPDEIRRMGAFLYKEEQQIDIAAQRWHDSCKVIVKQALQLYSFHPTHKGASNLADPQMTFAEMLKVLPFVQGVFLEAYRALINTHIWGGGDLIRMAYMYEERRQSNCSLIVFMEDFKNNFANTARCMLEFWRIEGRVGMSLDQAMEATKKFDLSDGKMSHHATRSGDKEGSKQWIKALKDDHVLGDILARIADVMARPALRRCS